MKKLVFALLIAGAVGSASAQRAYVGAGIVASNQNYGFPSPVVAADGDGVKASPKLFLGYDFNQTWGIEAGYTYFRGADYHYSYLGQTVNGEVEQRSMYLAGKITLPIADRFSFVGKLGIADNERTLRDPIFNGNEDKKGIYTSIGVQYLLNDKVSVSLDYEQYGKRHNVGIKANAFSLNARYAF
jgi:OOP family OmpA-OmpF porin